MTRVPLVMSAVLRLPPNGPASGATPAGGATPIELSIGLSGIENAATANRDAQSVFGMICGRSSRTRPAALSIVHGRRAGSGRPLSAPAAMAREETSEVE